jgi:hypothetical protein
LVEIVSVVSILDVSGGGCCYFSDLDPGLHCSIS